MTWKQNSKCKISKNLNFRKSYIGKIHITTLIVTLLVLTFSQFISPSTGGPVLADSGSTTLSINALNDVPGPVILEVLGWDEQGEVVKNTTLSWGNNNNEFSINKTEISVSTKVLRLTFINDRYIPPGGPDNDRNARIDYFLVANLRYEAEDFNRTGGPDLAFPGAGVIVLETSSGNVTVADCGNRLDYVEYDLFPIKVESEEEGFLKWSPLWLVFGIVFVSFISRHNQWDRNR
ncbi:MAG: hypothetical protein ACW99A_24115 [Candidatus Kariarchaeaceae archaeon]